ncbi:unnamed protein product [Camellia sinensis]
MRERKRDREREMMEVKEALFMNGGEGESSYAQNSSFAIRKCLYICIVALLFMFMQKVASMTMSVLEIAVETLFSKDFHLLQALNAADLGCVASPNTFTVISTIKRMVEKKCRELNCETLELQVYLNDLPGNDFNTLFKGLSSKDVFGNKCEEVSCYVMGVPGSFHGQLFPGAPKGLGSKEGLALNKGKIYISMTSPHVVREAYLSQFHEDFTMFLNARSQEAVPNGCMVLILHGRKSSDPSKIESCFTWELLAIAIAELASQGLELDSSHMQEKDKWVRGEKLAKAVRAFKEPIISKQFGYEIMNKLYDKFTHIVVSDLEAKKPKTTSIILVLSKIVG